MPRRLFVIQFLIRTVLVVISFVLVLAQGADLVRDISSTSKRTAFKTLQRDRS